MLLSDLFSFYLVEADIREATKDYYFKQAKAMFNYWDMDTFEVEALTKIDVMRFIQNPKWKATTKNKYITFIKTLLQFGLKEEIIEDSKEVKRILNIEPLKGQKTHFKTLPNEQLTQLMKYYETMPKTDYVGYRNKMMLGICLYSGIRRTELTYLKTSNINWDENSIYLEHTKNGVGRRIYFTKDFADELKAYVKKYPYEWLFCSRYKEHQCIAVKGVANVFYKFRYDLGFPLCIHDIRHTFATTLANDGVDVFALRDLMGHTNLSTTQIYVDEGLNRAKKELNEHNLFSIVGRKDKDC